MWVHGFEKVSVETGSLDPLALDIVHRRYSHQHDRSSWVSHPHGQLIATHARHIHIDQTDVREEVGVPNDRALAAITRSSLEASVSEGHHFILTDVPRHAIASARSQPIF